ncbi:hypothetical protein VNI00_018371 [Paramarasmius palmivorus]|uniref:Uncharacterized protein n=1 Tax=Paramarasmius palmivorus TaxID=297713 RepID=A0AAW0AXP7_9AGAR
MASLHPCNSSESRKRSFDELQAADDLPQHETSAGDVGSVLYAKSGNHYSVDGEIFSIIGMTAFDAVMKKPPLVQYTPSAHYSRLPSFHQMTWLSDELPFLPFVPKWNVFKSNILKSLDVRLDAEIVEVLPDGRYALRSHIQDAWDYCERMHRLLLTQSMTFVTIPLSPRFRLWSYPRQYGYQRSHKSLALCLRQVTAARDSFLPLIAAIIFFLRYTQRILDLMGREPNGWRTKLAQCSGIDLVWVTEWLNTFLPPIGSSACLHVGGFVDALQAMSERTDDYLAVYSFGCVPVVLFWGPGGSYETSRLSTSLRAHCPTRAGIDFLLANCSTVALSKYTLPDVLVAPHVGDPSQKPYETIHEFFARRKRVKETRLGKESIADRESRLARERNAALGACPGKKGARVFVWELDGSHLVRMPVSRSEVSDVWHEFAPTQRRYDSVYNEWDLWSGFAPSDAPADDGFGSDYDSMQETEDLTQSNTAPALALDPGVSTPPTTTHPPVFEEGEILEVFDDSEAIHNRGMSSLKSVPDIFLSVTEVEFVPFDDSVESVVHHRYAMSDSFAPAPGHSTIPWRKAEKILGFYDAPVDEHSADKICRFVEHILSVDVNNLSSSDACFDYVDVCSKLRRLLQTSLRLRHVKAAGLYVLDDASTELPFVIAVSDSLVVVELVLRDIIREPVQIARFLMSRGFPFRTLMCGPYREIEPVGRSKSSPLGYRPASYVFTTADYFAYQAQLHRFFLQPRARSAVLRGGILARIARPFVHDQSVLNGPSDSIITSAGIALCVLDNDQSVNAFWDDDLTDDDISIICGVYDVGTGQFDSKGEEQLAQRSWWPRPHSWDGCGLNTGCWNPQAELWFTRREEKYLSSQSAPLSHKHWKDQLKFTKESSVFTNKLRAVSATVLAGFIS